MKASKILKSIDRSMLLLMVDFEKGIVWIKWIGTHKDYNKIDVKEVAYERS